MGQYIYSSDVGSAVTTSCGLTYDTASIRGCKILVIYMQNSSLANKVDTATLQNAVENIWYPQSLPSGFNSTDRKSMASLKTGGTGTMLVMKPKISQLILVLWLNLRMILILVLYILDNPKGLSIEFLETIKLYLVGPLFIPLKLCVPTYKQLNMAAYCCADGNFHYWLCQLEYIVLH